MFYHIFRTVAASDLRQDGGMGSLWLAPSRLPGGLRKRLSQSGVSQNGRICVYIYMAQCKNRGYETAAQGCTV